MPLGSEIPTARLSLSACVVLCVVLNAISTVIVTVVALNAPLWGLGAVVLSFAVMQAMADQMCC